MKRNRKKLSLSRNAIRKLTDAQDVQGGALTGRAYSQCLSSIPTHGDCSFGGDCPGIGKLP